MNLRESINLINSFSGNKSKFSATANEYRRVELEKEKSISFPLELKDYIDNICPNKSLSFESVGHPVELLPKADISWKMLGYNVSLATNEKINNWNDAWFLIGSEGGDPIIVNLNENDSTSVVYSAMRGAGDWEFCPIADSIGQFLVCAAAVEHALTFPGVEEPLDEAFNLVGEAARWFFPFLKANAGEYYDEWASVFENYQL